MSYADTDLDTRAIVELAEAHVLPLSGTPAWEEEISHLRTTPPAHRGSREDANSVLIDIAAAAG